MEDQMYLREAQDVIGAVNTRALGEQVGHLTLEEQRTLDDALQLVLDLP